MKVKVCRVADAVAKSLFSVEDYPSKTEQRKAFNRAAKAASEAASAEAAEFRNLVAAMRKAQKAYFAARFPQKSELLSAAKQLEAKVDAALKPVDEFDQPDLFGEGGGL